MYSTFPLAIQLQMVRRVIRTSSLPFMIETVLSVSRYRFDRHIHHQNIAATRGRPPRTGPLKLKKTYRYRVAAATAIAQGVGTRFKN